MPYSDNEAWYNNPVEDLIVQAHFLDVLTSHGTASFKSVYLADNSISWVSALALAFAAGAFVFFTGGMATGLVAALGTWVGGLMGYSGIVATNAGLALLGGGAIAAGGFGMAGGAAVLAAALTFGTDLVFDQAVSRATATYSYRSLTQDSQHLMTLPLPKNEDGPDAYQSGLKVLKGLDETGFTQLVEKFKCWKNGGDCPEAPLLSDIVDQRNQIISQAIRTVDESLPPNGYGDRARVQTLQSLLHFVSNDYRKAKQHAIEAINMHEHAGLEKTDRSLPLFILSVAILYDEAADHAESLKLLGEAVHNEPDHPLIPLMYSIYLDRLFLRFDNTPMDEKDLHESLREVFRQMVLLNREEMSNKVSAASQIALLSRYLIRLKLEQQKIMALVLDDEVVRIESTADVFELDRALRIYKIFLDDGKPVLEAINKAIVSQNGRGLTSKIPFMGDRKEDASQQVEAFTVAFDGYYQDYIRLACLGRMGRSSLNNHFLNMELAAKEIQSLGNSENDLIRTHPNTARRVAGLLEVYNQHLQDSQNKLDELSPKILEECDSFPETQFRDIYLELASNQPRLASFSRMLSEQHEIKM